MVTLTQIKGNHKQKTPENYWMMVLLYFASFLFNVRIKQTRHSPLRELLSSCSFGGIRDD